MGFNSIPLALIRLRREALDQEHADSPVQLSERQQRSLSTLTQRFVQLFLTSPDNIVSLDNAAYTLCSEYSLCVCGCVCVCGCMLKSTGAEAEVWHKGSAKVCICSSSCMFL